MTTFLKVSLMVLAENESEEKRKRQTSEQATAIF